MAVQFVRASSTYLYTTDLPLSGMPFVFGNWYWMNSVGTSAQANMSLSNGSLTTGFYFHGIGSDERLVITANDGTSTTTSGTTILTANGGWVYLLTRFISATNRRTSILLPSGLVEGATNTTSRNPTGITRLGFGANVISTPALFADGKVAEAFVATGDIASSDQPVTRDQMMQLAYNGPFSIPNVASQVRFYASFRDSVTNAFIANRDSNGLLVPTSLTTSATAPSLVNHPPLGSEYERPRENSKRLLLI